MAFINNQPESKERADETSEESFALVSVIVCAHNEGRFVRSCLQAILANSYPSFEVIVVDDGSTDSTAEELATFDDPRVRVLRQDCRRGAAHSRNQGAACSRGEFLLFTDADCLVAHDWIEQMIACFREGGPQVLGVEGAMYYGKKQPDFTDELPLNPFYPKRHRSLMNVPGQDFGSGNISFRRESFLQAGGFNASRYAFGREDTDLAERIRRHGIIAFAPAAQVTHQSSSWNWRKLLRNALRYRDDVTFYKDHRFFFFRCGVFFHPRLLLFLLCPLLIPVFFPIRRKADLLFSCQFYAYLVLLRLNIWRQGIRERVLAI